MVKTKEPPPQTKDQSPEVEPLAGNVTTTPPTINMTGVHKGAVTLGASFPWDPNATAVSAAGAAVSVTLNPPDADSVVEIGRIDFSYSTAPTGGALTITDGGTVVFQIDTNLAGGQSFPFRQPRAAKTKGSPIVVTLASGGGAVVGKLNVNAWCRR